MEEQPVSTSPVSARDRQRALEVVLDQLFDEPDLGTFAVLDGARVEQLVREIGMHGVESECLLAGELDPSVARVAPRLVRLDEESDFVRFVVERGFGRSWGIFVRFAGDLVALRTHLRSLLVVALPDGRPVHFRYYDPRVFRLYLPTCNAAEVAAVFGPVASYAMESEDGRELLVFRPDAVPPRLERVSLTK